MQTTILPITYPAAVDDPWWIRVAQLELTDDTATVSETADLLDALYSIDPCDAAEADLVEPTAEDVTAAVVQAYSLAICIKDTDGSITLPVRLYRSHQEIPYILRVSGGRVVGGPVITPEEVTAILTVEQQSSITLEYPVIDGFTAEWIGTVSEAAAVPVDGPTIHRTGNTLHWQGRVTGTIQVAFVSVFDALSILVDGVDGEMGQATVRTFYHGDCTVFVPTMPEPAEMDGSLCPDVDWKVDPSPNNVTCYQSVTVRKLCSCSKEEAESETFDRIMPCPDYAPTRCPGNATDCMHLLGSVTETEYVECEEDEGYAVADREFYKQTCCEYPSVTLPRCPEEIESYSGGKPIEHGEAFWRSLYGAQTRFIPVSPEGGCGKHVTRQQIEPESCCDTIDPLVWDADNSIDTIQDNDTGYLYVKDGLGPFVWRIFGDGYLFFSDSATYDTLITDDRFAAIATGAYPCGSYTVTCTDSCGTVVSGEVLSTYGEWVERAAPARGWWEADDVPGAPFSYGAAEISLTTIGWYPGMGGILTPAIVAVTGTGESRVKYVQGIATDFMFSTSIESGGYACKTEDGCPLNPEAYGQSFTIPETGEYSEFVLGGYGIALNCDDPYDCRGRIYDPDWSMLLGAGPSGAPAYADLEVFSGDFAMDVRQMSDGGGCVLGRCGITIWVKCFSYNVKIYDWEC